MADDTIPTVQNENRVVVLKATVIGSGSDVNAPSAAQAQDAEREFYQKTNTVPPPYPPDRLLHIIENSSCLPQNIEAYVTNIDGLGHRLEPVVDLDSDEAWEHVREAMWIDRVDQTRGADAASEARPTDEEYDVPPPTDDEVKALVERLKRAARVERARLTTFIDYANPNGSFVQLRRDTRRDLESTGNAYWEVLRDARGRVARLIRVPPSTIRVTPLDRESVAVDDRVAVGLTRWETLRQHRFFRRFVQVTDNGSRSTVWFKQFGDPRVVSRASGNVYPDAATMETKEPRAIVANEMIHFAIGRGAGGYGIPRWIGALLAVLGTRASEDVNYAYFDNKGVPPLALLVSGGRLAADSVEKITGFVENNLKGRANFHKILVIEATSAEGDMPGNGQTPQLRFERLLDAQQGDALFLRYDERNADKIGSTFRLPRLLRGDVKDINRACYSEDTEVLTEQGWVLHDAVPDGARIALYAPDTGAVTFEAPTGLYAAPYQGDMVHVHNVHTDVLVTPDHKMTYFGAGIRDVTPRTVLAADLPTRFRFPQAAAVWEGVPPSGMFTLPCRTDRKCDSRREHNHVPIPWSAWLEFVGYVVSDGGILNTACESKPLYWTMIRAKKAHVVARMRACLARLGWHATESQKADGSFVWTISHRCLWEWVRDNTGGYSDVRCLPDAYTRLDSASMRVLLSAMWAGDGSVDPRDGRTSRTYFSKSTRLAGQVQQMMMLLGSRAHMNPGAGCWRVQTSEYRATRIRKPEDVQTVPYSGMVYCFSTRTGFYVTRRNGKIAMQGNTALASLRFADDQVFEPERMEFDGWMNRVLLPVLGVRLWHYRSLALRTRDPETMASVIAQMNGACALVPNESREIMADALGRELAPIDAEWAKQPGQLTLAGYRPFADGGDTGEVTPAGAGVVGISPTGDDGTSKELRVIMRSALTAAHRREGVIAAARARAIAEDDSAAGRDEVNDAGSHEA